MIQMFIISQILIAASFTEKIERAKNDFKLNTIYQDHYISP